MNPFAHDHGPEVANGDCTCWNHRKDASSPPISSCLGVDYVEAEIAYDATTIEPCPMVAKRDATVWSLPEDARCSPISDCLGVVYVETEIAHDATIIDDGETWPMEFHIPVPR